MSDRIFINPHGRVCIVVATKNEMWNIQEVVQRARPFGTVLVVDNASEDRTVVIAQKCGAQVLQHEVDTHIKQSYVDGFRWALERDFQKVVQLDAGLSFHPYQIERLLWPDAALVLGQRWARDRKRVSLAGSWLAQKALGLPFEDVTCGFRCWTAQALRYLDLGGFLSGLQCRAHGFQIELLYHAYASGLKIETVPVTYVPGRSSANRTVAWEALRAVWRLANEPKEEW